MDRAQEWALAWDLMDVAAPVMQPDVKVWLCAKIGAGEVESAIDDTLRYCATHRIEISEGLSERLRAWADGYAATDREGWLRDTVAKIRVAPGARQVAVADRPVRTSTIAGRGYARVYERMRRRR